MATGRSSTSNFFAANISYKLLFFAIVFAYPCFGALNNCPSTRILSVPLVQLGNKEYYIGHFVKANWYNANQFCVLHGMRLASIETNEENTALVNYLHENGLGQSDFWTSGTDLGREGYFVWFGNGKPITFTNWAAGQPNNTDRVQHCIELWDATGSGHKWNDENCNDNNYFVCEN